MAWVQLVLVAILAMTVAGCELAQGIFKAGAWVGALAVILVIAVVGVIAAKVRG